MSEEENRETSKETPRDEAGTNAEETPAASGREAEEAAVDGEAASPSEEESQPDSPATSEGGEPTQASEGEESGTVAEEPADSSATSEGGEAPQAAEGAEDEAPAATEPPAEKPAKEDSRADKKDVIPGADLEPIAVEQADERPLSAEERARREAEEEERRQREAALAGDGDEEEARASRAPAKLETGSRFQATGKRKRSIARVTLVPGGGQFMINGRALEEFFPRQLHQTMARQPLATTGYEDSVDVRIRVHGGGIGGQAGAIRHGIARALTEIDPELRSELKRRGFLTRDARAKERRKAGLKKARKRPQFSKR